jgi:hypothetical protein
VPHARLVVSRFVSGGETVGVFLRGPHGRDDGEEAARLAPFGPALEAALGVPAGPDRFLYQSIGPTITDDPASWESAISWLMAETDRYVAAASSIVGLSDG